MSEELLIITNLLHGTLQDEICRICLTKSVSLVPLEISIVSNECTAKEMMESISSIQFTDDTNMPQNICTACLDKVTHVYQFRLKCEQSDNILHNCIASFTQQISNAEGEAIIIVMQEELEDNGAIKFEIKQEIDEGVPVAEQDPRNVEMKSPIKFLKVKPVVSSNKIKDIHFHPASDNEDKEILDMLIKKTSNVDKKTVKNENNALELSKPKMSCSVCLLEFQSGKELSNHLTIHTATSRHTCNICKRSFSKSLTLQRHMKIHTGKWNFTCKDCGKIFHYRNSLNAHMRLHAEKVYACKLCNFEQNSKIKIVSHLKKYHEKAVMEYGGKLILVKNANSDLDETGSRRHNEKDIFDCTMCFQSFNSLDGLEEHKILHPEDSRHICRTCGKSYVELGTLKRHKFQHTGKKPYLCTYCGKRFFFQNLLNAHMIYHKEKKEVCDYCEKKFHTKHVLKEHLRIAHSVERYKFMCDTCGKLYGSKQRLQNHKNTHATNKAFCMKCGKSYKNLRYFKDHMKKHDGIAAAEREFICDYCGQVRKLKTLMELHILSKHLNERRYKCGVCDKGFFSNGALKEHGVVHRKVKPELCDICNKRFVNKKSLLLHQRLHSGERPFPCGVCGERFLCSSRRQVHMKSRHGNKMECCGMCPLKFYLRSELNKHMASHLKEPINPKVN